MITLSQCSSFSGLAGKEMILGGSSSTRQRMLLSSYVLNLWRGPDAVRHMIVRDIRACVELGSLTQAADLLLVLRRYLTEYPEARLAQPRRRRKAPPTGCPIGKAPPLEDEPG